MSPESTIEKGQYSVADVAKLFALDSNVEAATVGWLQYPIPKTICWTNLRKFNFTASIADYNSLANVIIQLPVLQSLSINCYSMIREDVVHTPFPDQKHTFSEIGEVFNSDDFTPLSMRLERLELMVYTGRFDYDGLCGLLTRLPQVTFIRTSAKAAAVVQGFFYNLYEGRRNVHVESFAT
ncbi:hypothetical protein FBU59_004161 [Linderina macrospora]|uniref:Uncharacterized protein n=1 Tax=Linderina macrospora TaxID=4868 RepID=A0ACC1J6K1_9FUNG|nr:hypothetical protein FBU59_004161 [Linderina macrospora]